SVEQREHARVFRPQRPLAGGTRALRAELHDLVALLFHFFVLFEQLGALGLGVLPVAYPHRTLLLRGPLDRLQPPLQFARPGIRRCPSSDSVRSRRAIRSFQRGSSRPSASSAARRAASALLADLRAPVSRCSAACRAAASAAPSGRPASRPRTSAATPLRTSRTRSCASRRRSYPSTRDRNAARSVLPSAAITANSFCPVKYVLTNSSWVTPNARSSLPVT